MEETSILIQRKQGRGDVLMITPVVRKLKETYPKSRIDVATACSEVLGRNPHIDNILPWDTPSHGYSKIFDLYNTSESRFDLHPVDSHAITCGVELESKQLEYFTPLERVFEHSTVVIHGGPTEWAGRDWTTEKFNETAHRLHGMGFETVNVGARKGHRTNVMHLETTHSLVEKTSVDELASILKAAHGFIGIDSFPAHLAQAMGCPSIVLFGMILPRVRLTGRNAVGLIGTAPCAGEYCSLKTHPYVPTCDGECITSIEVDRVLEAFNEITK